MCSDWSVRRHISLQCHPWSAGPGPVKVHSGGRLRVFLCWVVEGGSEEGCGEASVLGAQASGSSSRFHRDVSCFLCRPAHPPSAVVPWAPRSEKEPAFGSEEPRVPYPPGHPAARACDVPQPYSGLPKRWRSTSLTGSPACLALSLGRVGPSCSLNWTVQGPLEWE